jgi:hypothetical protein
LRLNRFARDLVVLAEELGHLADGPVVAGHPAEVVGGVERRCADRLYQCLAALLAVDPHHIRARRDRQLLVVVVAGLQEAACAPWAHREATPSCSANSMPTVSSTGFGSTSV